MKKQARPPQAKNSARNSVRFVEQLESRLAMASMNGDLGPSNDALPPADQSHSAVVGTHATNDIENALSDCICPPAPTRPWHNFNNAHDVDGDGEVAPSDALAIINYINATGSGPVPLTAPAAAPYLDTTADNQIAPDDVMAVVNQLHYLNLVDKVGSFSETVHQEFLSRIPLNVTDLHPVLRGNANEMPGPSEDGISYWDLQLLIQSVSRTVYDSQFAWGSREEAERAVEELLSKVVDDRAPSVFGF